jgi:hypothetical protein
MRRPLSALSACAVTLAAVAFIVTEGCGARTAPRQLRVTGVLLEGGPLISCTDDLDCHGGDLCRPSACEDGQCVPRPEISCDDGDPCTTDSCTPSTGGCEFAQRTLDSDGDSFRAPLPGTVAGAAGSCGDDCNDASALAHPGATETCDGVDNDCNGVADDGARYVATQAEPILLSVGSEQAGPGGLAFGDTGFAATFSSENSGWSNTFVTFDAFSGLTQEPQRITKESTDAFTGPLVFTGSFFASAWEDRRDGDFEIYFNRFDGAAKKLAPDVRVTRADEFSLRPSMVWDGSEFLLVWDDRREGNDSSRIFGQRIDKDGKLVGGNVPLTPADENADDARLVASDRGLGLVYNQALGTDRVLTFRSMAYDFTAVGKPVILGRDRVSSHAAAWSGDRFVIAWDTEDSTFGPTIRGATVSRDGTILTPARDITAKASFARSQSLLSLGDRLLLFWAEISDTPRYSIYTKTITPDLTELTPKERITSSPRDSVAPSAAFGPGGVGVVTFEDRRTGAPQVYATRLECVAGR